MKLVAKDRPAGLDRYRHIKPARGWRVTRCGHVCPGTSYSCTRERGHRGPHVAHGLLGRLRAVWDLPAVRSGEPSRTPAPSSGMRRRRGQPIGLRPERSKSLLERAGRALKFLDDHGEEIALIVFFLAFVWFALDWLTIILG